MVISLISFFLPVMKICAYMLTSANAIDILSDHTVIKCAIDFPSPLANCQTIKVNTTGVVFGIKSPGVIVLPTGTRLTTGNLSPTTATIPRNYTKSYIDPTALLCPLVNPQSHWLIVLLTFFSNKIKKIRESFSSSESCNLVHPTLTLLH